MKMLLELTFSREDGFCFFDFLFLAGKEAFQHCCFLGLRQGRFLLGGG